MNTYLKDTVVQDRCWNQCIEKLGENLTSELSDIVFVLDNKVDGGDLYLSDEQWLKLEGYFPIDDYDDMVDYLIDYADAVNYPELKKFIWDNKL